MTESQNSSQIPLKPKGVYKNFKSWKFLDTIQEDALTGEFKDRKQLLIEHFQTRTTPYHNLCGFETCCPGSAQSKWKNTIISIFSIGYLQTKPSSPFTMTKWQPEIQSQPIPRQLVQQWQVPCRYGSLRWPVPNLVQAAHIRRTGFEQSGPYRRSRQAKGILSVAVQHSYPVPSFDSRVRLEREAAADKAKERA